MFTNRARLLVILLFLLLAGFFIWQHAYELVSVVVLLVGLLIWGYFKEGPIILAAKKFHQKDYEGAEALLLQIKKPALLSKKRRGFYEFLMGGVSLQKQDYAAAESHYEIAAQYPLRTVNDHVAALVHVANLAIRHNNVEKARAYFHLAKAKEEKVTAKMRAVIDKIEQELKQHK